MKTNFEHFFDICHGNKEFDEAYQPNVINNLFGNFEDTAEFASNMALITSKISKETHYKMFQMYNPKRKRIRPVYVCPKEVDKEK
jgi:hypothetical protein